jgi:hypothetical protein
LLIGFVRGQPRPGESSPTQPARRRSQVTGGVVATEFWQRIGIPEHTQLRIPPALQASCGRRTDTFKRNKSGGFDGSASVPENAF